MKIYKKNKFGSVGYVDEKENRFVMVGSSISPYKPEEYTDPTSEEIQSFEEREVKHAAVLEAQLMDEQDLLALCGLKHDDFVRFRGVYICDPKTLVAETRENGMNMRSSNAIKNPNYRVSYSDETDGTYEYYEFNIPEEKCKV